MSELLPALPPIAQIDASGPTMPYWQLFTRADGLSSIAAGMLDGFGERSVGGKAAAMWMRAVPGHIDAVWFTVLPVGWRGDWHASPKAQWVVTLSGRWFIEAQDGARIEMGPGEIHWGQDFGTRAVDGNHGHLSGQLGEVPCAQLLVQFAVPPGDLVPPPACQG